MLLKDIFASQRKFNVKIGQSFCTLPENRLIFELQIKNAAKRLVLSLSIYLWRFKPGIILGFWYIA